jgi:hypothetical protein
VGGEREDQIRAVEGEVVEEGEAALEEIIRNFWGGMRGV